METIKIPFSLLLFNRELDAVRFYEYAEIIDLGEILLH